MNRVIYLIVIAIGVISNYSEAVSQSDYASSPPIASESSSAFTMINLSVEWTQQAEAYTDGEQVYVGKKTFCPGRIDDLNIGGGSVPDSTGICYHQDEIYIGYFDPNKCYVYDTSGSNQNSEQTPTSPSTNPSSNSHPDPHFFRPVRLADSGHKCKGQEFSGNFMNWATMTAADEFRYATTGGARLVDTMGAQAKTLLTRAHRRDWRFVNKAISADGLSRDGVTFQNDPKDVTAFNGAKNLIVEGHEFKTNNPYNGQLHNTTTFYTFKNGRRKELGTFNIIVEVCNPDVGLEPNCKEYTDGNTTWYKPEGVLLENAQSIRYALMTYTAKSGNEMGGGVLRAQAKHVGYFRPLPSGGVEVNPEREIDEFGRYIYNPDGAALRDGVRNSGLLNYINSFGLGRYKNRDPVSEIFYEGLRYFRGLQPTPEYIGKSTDSRYHIPLDDSDKDNFPFIEQWEDPIVDACQTNYMIAAGDQFAFADSNLPGTSFNVLEPSVPDDFFNVTDITDEVGKLEGYVGRGPTLGKARRWQPNNTYYIAGLAYSAHTTDIRPDIEGIQTVKTFIVDTQEFKDQAPEGRENQLWLTAKYGGFNDTNGDKDPNNKTPGARTDEWDADKDGNPDTYTLASQPANLIAGLRAALGEISNSVNAGSSLGAVTNNSSGETLLVQALYQPRRATKNGSLEWTGVVQSLFLDSVGRFREDARVNGNASGDGKITDADPVITFTTDSKTGVTLANRSQARGDSTVAPPYKTGIDPEQLHTVWNVRDELAKLTDFENNRDYSDIVGPDQNHGRYIFTYIDQNSDNQVAQSEIIEFTQENFSSGVNAAYLGLAQDDTTQPQDIVNYIRGVEYEQFRSRSSDFDGDDVLEPWLLGDVISSSPIVDAGIGSITRYDAIYRDTTLSQFIDTYKDSRHMVYFGANDGMIRGVNAGFFDRQEKAYTVSSPGKTAHPLGAEMWAYVPQSVLPHLQWLKNKDYKHNYYVDGIPHLYTVNIFGGEGYDKNIYPNGWGKILVVGTGFGGGKFSIDTDNDGQQDTTTLPSFIILDVTNPEAPPKLIAEISHPDLGFTTSRPTLAFFRKPGRDGSYQAPTRNDWYLVMGSGPTGTSKEGLNAAVTQGVSDQQARVFVYDLVRKDWVNFTLQNRSVPYYRLGNQDNAFIGAATAVDWDERDGYSTDAIYLGTVGGRVGAPTGDMFRLVPGEGGVMSEMRRRKLLVRSNGTLGEPIQGVPKTVSRLGEHWVYFGSGRFIGDQDIKSQSQAGFYAVREFPTVGGQPHLRSTSQLGQLFNVTNIATKYDPSNPAGELVNAQGEQITNENNRFASLGAANGDEVINLTLEDLTAVIRNKRGWYRRFSEPNARQVGRIEAVNDAVFYTVYTPGLDVCDSLGSTNLVGVNATAGISPAFSILGNQDIQGSTPVASNEQFLSVGLVRDVAVLNNLTFEAPKIIDNSSGGNGGAGDDGRNNPGIGGGNNGQNTPGNNSGSTDSNLPNGPTGAGGGSGGSNGSSGGQNQANPSGVECGPGFPIASLNAAGTLGIQPVRNCRRLSGRLSWREVPIPW